MPDTFIKIASVTVGSGGASTIVFSSIPATYTDLVVKVSGRSTSSGGDCSVTFNSSGGTAYSSRLLYGDGSAAASASSTGAAFATWGAGAINRSTTTSNTFASTDIYIPNYAGSNHKTLSTDSVEENNATQAYSELAASLWANSAAITSITLTPSSSGNFVQYSTATLYGIKNS
jgi:aspartate/tyrosine/aromatic aminotransferase